MKTFIIRSALLLTFGLISAVAQSAGPTANLLWTAPTTNTDGSAVVGALTYNVYQGAQGAALVKVASAISGTTTNITAGLASGSTQCFAVSAIEGGVEGAQSNTACAAIPVPKVNAPTQITVVIH
jgi:hypothetical protein